HWAVEPDLSELDFHGALGRGAWHLQVRTDGAVLQLADGTVQSAPRVSQLIQDRIGWSVPLEALQWWVRGLAAPGVIENETLGQEGLLVSLRQFGWSVNFNRYDSFNGLEMPVRLDASRKNYRVKLVISRWRLDVDDEFVN
ncbi:MAG: lipoprotein insertase outer membrane protein LolB, partial [Lysobacterales bacterium]